MAAEQYFVVLDNSEWKIGFKDKHYGPYNSEGEAVEAAYAMGNIGIDAQVLIQGARPETKKCMVLRSRLLYIRSVKKRG